MVAKVEWHGRCGAVHLFAKPFAGSVGTNVWIVGVHLAHEDFEDSLADVAYALSRKPPGAAVRVVGDFNADFLPCSACDAWQHLPDREEHHRAP